MNNCEFTVDTSQVLNLFAEFDKKMRKQTFRTVLRKGATILQKQTISNLKGIVKNIDRINTKYNSSLRKGVKYSIGKDNQSAKVHIMNDFRLKFFELGTQERYNKKIKGKPLKKERYVGKIRPYYFFKTAKEQTETQIFSSMEKMLIETIEKINNKKYK
jgi:hypothetical protein